MDDYIKQFIVVVIILLLVSTYNIVRLMNNKYPSVLIDFIFHAVFIFTGLFLFFYFYVKNLIKDNTNGEINNLLNSNSTVLQIVTENLEKNLTPEQIINVKNVLKTSIDSTNDNEVIQEANEKNYSILSTGLKTCIVIFVIAIFVTIVFKYYYKYEINLTSIILVNLYIFIATLCVEYLILTIILDDNIQPLSESDFAKIVFDRFKYNLDNQF